MKKYFRKINFILVIVLLVNSFYLHSQNTDKYIKCFALNDSYVVKSRTELIIPIKFINSKKVKINLGGLLHIADNKGGYCIPTKYEVLYRNSTKLKYKNFLFIEHKEGEGSKVLQFSSAVKTGCVYIPDVLSEAGYYKFRFSIYYLIGKSKKLYSVRTQWVNIRVL